MSQINAESNLKTNYNGLLIGGIATLISLLSSRIFLIPMFSVIPGGIIELLASFMISNEPYSNVGKMTIFLLLLILLSVLTLSLRSIYQQTLNKIPVSITKIVFIMFAFYFIVHPLGFYIHWGINMNFRGDGQLIFLSVESFPISSFSFIFIGFFIDCVKNNVVNKKVK